MCRLGVCRIECVKKATVVANTEGHAILTHGHHTRLLALGTILHSRHIKTRHLELARERLDLGAQSLQTHTTSVTV